MKQQSDKDEKRIISYFLVNWWIICIAVADRRFSIAFIWFRISLVLGTTIRASVHIKVPKLAADKSKLDKVAEKYHLQVRGTSGEHTEAVGGVYDISNKRRMGLTEYQAVKEMHDGILEIIKLESSMWTDGDSERNFFI